MRPKKVILVVGADEVGQSVLSYILVTHAYKVIQATIGLQAIAIFCSTQVDLVLTDARMPLMDGFELANRLKQVAGHIPIIILGEPEKMIGVFHAGDALLNKNTVTSAELLERIRIMSARKRGPRKGFLLRRAEQEAKTA